MGGRDWTLKRDEHLRVRIPGELKLALEVLAKHERITLSDIVIRFLSESPEVVEMLDTLRMLVDKVNSTGGDESP